MREDLIPTRMDMMVHVHARRIYRWTWKILTIFRNKSRLRLLHPQPENKKATVSKFIMSLRDDAYQVLQLEATRRWISVQELLRAVIIPEWVEQNPPAQKILGPRLAHPLIRS